ncbi:nuclear cap-binding protein subunit 1 [Amborella trichopoda]|uniref:Nuclear cap-binding protein subunit 1 n=1 Tax=Amborella trichopoda TaxID=13333 RepID=W1PP24_AMBTC|nr:nuclear cap-binding protein subunit 1 [Amborella trichopoda]XP_020525130.1 nuclear cap-binding protein subunit 1 [Amborella trichopoda]ERN09808.1 hypothetical protein AMTR_s00029p00245860 [Amborella trichopoda]|eukprot:XP_006848227.1 nuclear cap-binding protein subunit 1 [Amborella trichopoda]
MSSWRSFLLRIGDKCPEYGGNSDIEDHIEKCYGILWRELDHSPDDISLFLLQCAEQLPHKSSIYGTLVGLINLDNDDFVKRVVSDTQTNLQNALDLGSCDKIRILLRFLTVLMCSNVVQPSAVIEVFEALLSSAATTVDEEKGNPSWQARADFYVTCILSCLPWGGAELFERASEEIERVMVGIEAYLSIRKRVSDTGFLVFDNDDKTDENIAEKDFLEDLWERIQALSSNGWKVDSAPRPHLSFEARLVSGKCHDFGPISCPEQPAALSSLSMNRSDKQKHEAELKYPQRLRRLNIFPASKIEENMQPIDRFIVEEYLLDVLMYLNGCRKECAAYMVGLPVPFRYEYLMAETIFSQLLLLPQPAFKPIYYTLVIIDLCKALPGAFPAVVAGAVRAIFERVGDLDMECRTRLVLWFSHHLSNFQFIWQWEEWAHCLDLPKWAPQRVFVQEVLEREVRLSYWDKIKQSIENASTLEELLPPNGGPSFKYSAGDSEEHSLSENLCTMVRGRKTAREVISWLEEAIVPTHGPKVALEVVVQTLLDIGSKSFTHLVNVLERYGQVISKLCPDQEKQVWLIDEVSLYWKNSAQMTALTIDRMMGYRLVSNLSIISWVFSPANVKQFHTSDRPWEILRNAVGKTYNRIRDLRKEISSLEKSIVSAEASAAEAQAESDAAESRLEVVDGEPIQAEPPSRLKRLKAFAEKAKEEAVSLQESLEAKQALLSRAITENEAMFISLYKSLANVLMECLPRVYCDKHNDHIQLDLDDEESSKMDVDDDENKKSNRGGEINGHDTQEEEHWCHCTLGYVKALSRQYASEIWLHIEKLDAEVFTKDMHPSFLNAVYAGLRRPYR